MKVFLTSATGYIGSAVADALKAAGHQVIGLARSDEAQGRLEARGIGAFRGDLNNASRVAEAAREADAVIHTASTNDANMASADRNAVEAILGALEGTNKPFIYTSGIWVIGDTSEIADETSSINPTPLIAFRPAVEEIVLAASYRGVRTVVLPNGMVYGRGGGVFTSWVQSAKQKGAAEVVGTGENYWAVIHVDDLADLYILALEKAPALPLLIAASDNAVVGEMAAAASRGAGAGGKIEIVPLETARQFMGVYADAKSVKSASFWG
ncbi:MAG: NAD-dependent epimerase/dehydratase family protein [Heteroscytonema crispum UTEX LB 1556]